MQINSDVTGLPLEVPYSDTATTLGAALLAGVGIGMYANFEQAVNMTVQVTRRYKPNPVNHELYQNNYRTYLNLYHQLKDIMHNCRKENTK